MRVLGRIFLAGLAAMLPLAFTAWLLVWLGRTSESMLGGLIRFLLPENWYVPGLGVALGVALVLVVGVLMQLYLFQRLFEWAESLLERIPVIKTIYGSVRDMIRMFSPGGDREAGKPVIVRLPGNDQAMLGFITQDRLPEAMDEGGKVAVYLPMSYQIGGFTVMIPAEQLEPLDMGAQDAMRFVITAGVGAARKDRQS